ncbi:MAG: two-component system nitrate/nitrite sensor histidine kinase NarX [Pseudomonas sp.]
MLQSTISRLQRSGWQWPWQRSREDVSCLRLLQALPLRMLQRPGSEAPLLELLAGLAGCLRARQAFLLLPVAGQSTWRRIGEAHCMGDCPLHAGNTLLPAAGSVVLCVDCLRVGEHRLICVLAMEEGAPGALLLEFSRMPSMAIRSELAEIGGLLAETLGVLAEDRQQRRRELAVERGVLSRELHDSVAQQLSYLQIRASRLQAILQTAEQDEVVGAMLVDLRDTLASLHRQVRELIATARLTMDGCSLRQALEASVEEFSRRSSCVFSLDNRLPAERIGHEAELQILQIVREALANVVRHSHARHVRIALLDSPQHGVEILVADDGIGLPEVLPEDAHFGLRIMRERAIAIGASLQINSSPQQGTQVHLLWSDG